MAKKQPPPTTVPKKNSGHFARLARLKEGFATSADGTSIYYKSVGCGLPLVLCNGMWVSTFFWKYFENTFKREFQVITWDYRGHGRSEQPRDKNNVSVAALVEDCHAVCKELKLKKAVFIGHSLGTQV